MAVAQISWLQLGEAESSTAQISWLQIDGVPAAAGQVALLSWLQIDGAPVAPIPDAPSDVEGAATGGTTATSTWADASSDETGFLVQISPDGSTWSTAGTVGAGVQTFAHTGLDPATLYYTGVTALGAAGNSARAVSAGWWTDNTGTGGGEIPLPTVFVLAAPSTHPRVQISRRTPYTGRTR